jgi:death on curing protein
MNGWELVGTVDEQERLMLDLADGQITREQLTAWLEQHAKRVGR